MNIGQRIREVREDLGMQAAVLARRVGVAPNTIYRIEHGDRTPSVALVEKIARELRTEPAELFKEPVPFEEDPRETGRPAAQVIAQAGPSDETEENPTPALEHRYDEAFNRAVEELRHEGLGDAVIAENMRRYADRLEATTHD
jgi:transcriptional regulator with XRE-family HTH domain